MASPFEFAQYPPFPEDVPVAKIERISLGKLLGGDQGESDLLWHCCRTSGFFLLDCQTHRSGERLLNGVSELRRISEELFDLNQDEKSKFAYTVGSGPIHGYKAQGSGKVDAKGTLDRYELYNISEDDMSGVIDKLPAPAPIENNRSAIQSYIASMRSIVEIVFAHLNAHLKLAPGTLEALHNPKNATGSQVRMLKFLPQPEGDRRLSLFHHTDIGSITVLFNTIGGLQLLPPSLEDSEENWQYVKPEPGCAIINLGDSMTQLTNGLLRSNIHRVTYAPGDQATYTRYSLGFFAKPEMTALMNPLEESEVIPPLKNGEAALNMSAQDWATKKLIALKEGVDVARSQGGN